MANNYVYTPGCLLYLRRIQIRIVFILLLYEPALLLSKLRETAIKIWRNVLRSPIQVDPWGRGVNCVGVQEVVYLESVINN